VPSKLDRTLRLRLKMVAGKFDSALVSDDAKRLRLLKQAGRSPRSTARPRPP